VKLWVPTQSTKIDVGSIESLGVDVGEKASSAFAGQITYVWLSHLNDSPLKEMKGLKPRRIFLKFLRALKTDGLRFWIDSCSDLASRFQKNYEREDASTCVFMEEFLQLPIAMEYITFHREQDPVLFKYILSWLRFLKKAEFNDDELKQKAFVAWLETEERISGFDYDIDLVASLYHVLDAVLPTIDYSCFMGKHGPGYTADGAKQPDVKSLNLSISPKLRRALFLLRLNNKELWNYIDYLLDICGAQYTDSEPTAKLTFVPKSYKTARSICMEPTTYMFLQQHFMYMITKSLSRSVMGRFIRIDDQTRNQRGAVLGSALGYLDTIDLSQASDSVTEFLVRHVFPRDWVHILTLTRTSSVELPDGTVKEVAKFAPMGSALCFPVQSVLFAGIAILAYIIHYHSVDPEDTNHLRDIVSKMDIDAFVRRNISDTFEMTQLYESIGVYGDDIIIDSRTSTVMTHLLRSLAFIPNSEKSYYGDEAFRESCGMYSYRGVDVTPFHLKWGDFQGSYDFEQVARGVSQINLLGDHGYMAAKGAFMRTFLSWKPPSGCDLNPIKFSSNRAHPLAIYSTKPRNDHLQSRPFDKERPIPLDPSRDPDPYQLGVVRSWVPRLSTRKPTEESVYAYDGYSYHMWHRATMLRGEEYFSTPRSIARRMSLRWGWSPTS
jgi:hypothetical protein